MSSAKDHRPPRLVHQTRVIYIMSAFTFVLSHNFEGLGRFRVEKGADHIASHRAIQATRRMEHLAWFFCCPLLVCFQTVLCRRGVLSRPVC